jgi:NAD(P)H dehydrogenase (quinone)
MKNPKNILVLCGHPDKESFSGTMADHYQAGAEDAGHVVQRVNIGELNFDPIFHKGYKEIQQLEPDLSGSCRKNFSGLITLSLSIPTGGALCQLSLKGLFDRFWLPGFAFNFNKQTKQIEKHLKGRTGRVIILSGSHSPFKTWWQFGDFTNEIQYGIMEFAGIRTGCERLWPLRKRSMTRFGKSGQKKSQMIGKERNLSTSNQTTKNTLTKVFFCASLLGNVV